METAAGLPADRPPEHRDLVEARLEEIVGLFRREITWLGSPFETPPRSTLEEVARALLLGERVAVRMLPLTVETGEDGSVTVTQSTDLSSIQGAATACALAEQVVEAGPEFVETVLALAPDWEADAETLVRVALAL